MKINDSKSLSFRAVTNIRSDEGLLSKKEINKLTKIGQKIGTNSDKIDFFIEKCDKNGVRIFYKANLSSLINSTETSNYYFDKIEKFNIFEYISKKMEYIRKVYRRIK